jgi:uncharacterized protein
MRKLSVWAVAVLFPVVMCAQNAAAPAVAQDDGTISPSRPVPVGGAPGMKWRINREDNAGEKTSYVLIFRDGDEALSGLTDFAIEHKIKNARFQAIGAAQSATLAWLDLSKKNYRKIAVGEQCEVLSLLGDIATFDGKPVVHMHAVLGRSDGSTVGGHVFELKVRPTLEVFVTTNYEQLKKFPDDASGMKLIDPTR